MSAMLLFLILVIIECLSRNDSDADVLLHSSFWMELIVSAGP